MVGVKCTRTAAYNVPTGTVTAIPWDTETYDTHGFHDNVTNLPRLTVPAGLAGYYQVQGAWGGPAGTDQKRVASRIRLNGVDVPGGVTEAPTSGTTNYVFANANVPLLLAVGDYVELYTYQDNAAVIVLDLTLAAFGMYLIGTAT